MNTNTTAPNEVVKECIDTCNSLLRGELSAVETYQKAIDKFDDDVFVTQLKDLQRSHMDSVSELRKHVIEMNGSPENDSGAWGNFANGVQSAANFFGDNAALSSLEAGEAYGQKDYENALEKDIMPEARALIQTTLLPRCRRNQEILDALEEAA
ncbi:DUF2383 domain-containing protein [Roseibacillus persicicus]|uniref:DUF2383 domain-containing protein n=1 Tax=Roseibacillus persicicus TaxID=454148 RepID=UPI00280ED48F|nr:DUF2383 domain-containing protein [Roseibacillus persicicus]MDQ8192554.1 DUF2383 domain-containing protein [Roseibacillus persicicus]